MSSRASSFSSALSDSDMATKKYGAGPRHSMTSPSNTHLDIEPEFDDVTVLHDVVLALHAYLAGALGRCLRAGRDEVVVRHDLGLDEPALEVGVNDAGRLGCGRANRDHPRARLLRPGGQVCLQPERGESDADQLM